MLSASDLEQPADDVVGLGKALVPLADAGPALANDMLVQPFAGPSRGSAKQLFDVLRACGRA
jgi:hypothetical protein